MLASLYSVYNTFYSPSVCTLIISSVAGWVGGCVNESIITTLMYLPTRQLLVGSLSSACV
jgi:hypothetical protein